MYVCFTLKCIIIETRADSVVVKSNGLGPVLAAIMHPGRLFNFVKHVSSNKKPKTVEFKPNGICSSLNNNAFQSNVYVCMYVSVYICMYVPALVSYTCAAIV